MISKEVFKSYLMCEFKAWLILSGRSGIKSPFETFYNSLHVKIKYKFLNIKKSILKEIGDGAEVLNISRSDVIIFLLKLVMENNTKKTAGFRSIKYQKTTDNCSWHKFHIRLREDDYEFFLDLRKFLKLSVSHILAIAVKKYMKRLLEGKITDNYQIKNYILTNGEKDGYKYFQIIWGLPSNIEEFIPVIKLQSKNL